MSNVVLINDPLKPTKRINSDEEIIKSMELIEMLQRQVDLDYSMRLYFPHGVIREYQPPIPTYPINWYGL